MRTLQVLLVWSASASLLILAVMALRALLGRRIGAGLRYALWGAVLLRLLLPVQLFTLPVPAPLPEAARTQAADISQRERSPSSPSWPAAWTKGS